MRRRSQQQISVDDLRTQISQRLRSNAAFSQTVYKEQPIIMTGAQLKSVTPDAIREARLLAKSLFAQSADVATVFYQQARLLAGYEDDYEFAGTFSQYYPTYEDMSNEQMRGYFAWRTKVRQGCIEQSSLSFAYVYLYELINLIGVAGAQEAYDKLVAFGSVYRQYDAHFGKLFDAWLDDFVIYYGLDASMLRSTSFVENDLAFDVLLNRETRTNDELFDALCQLSSYAIKQSPFFLEHEVEIKQVVAYGYNAAAQHHDQKLTTTLAAKLSGKLSKQRIWLFERAVFADPLDVQTTSYSIDAHDNIFCRNGAWFRVRYHALEGTLPWVSQLLETCECILRDIYQYPNTLEQSLTTKYLVKAISTYAQQMVSDAREREARAVHIDFGKLDHIREAADETCEKLIVEEEQPVAVFTSHASDQQDETNCPGPFVSLQVSDDKGGEDDREMLLMSPVEELESSDLYGVIYPSKPGQSATSPMSSSNVNDSENPVQQSVTNGPGQFVSVLDANEQELLILLLDGGSVRAFEQEHACIASVLIDSINEKLYDEFADICIDASAGEPEIIEDYRDDLRALVGMN